MKKLILLFLVMSCCLNSHAQTVFDQYAGNPDVSHLNISPQMFKILSQFKLSTSDPESQEFIEMIQSLTQFRVMSTQNSTIVKSMDLWVKKELSESPLTSILNITEKGVNVQFGAVFGENDNVKRLVMLVKGLQDFIDQQENIELNTTTPLDYVLLEIKGDIKLNQVSALTRLVDIPGGNYLEALED